MNELKEELLEANETIEVLVCEISELELECNKKSKKIKKLKNRIKEMEDAGAELFEDVLNIEEMINEYKVRVEDLNNKLNHANKTVALQMEGFDKMCEQYEGQLSVQDNEIKRLNVIINYLESRMRECEIDME